MCLLLYQYWKQQNINTCFVYCCLQNAVLHQHRRKVSERKHQVWQKHQSNKPSNAKDVLTCSKKPSQKPERINECITFPWDRQHNASAALSAFCGLSGTAVGAGWPGGPRANHTVCRAGHLAGHFCRGRVIYAVGNGHKCPWERQGMEPSALRIQSYLYNQDHLGTIARFEWIKIRNQIRDTHEIPSANEKHKGRMTLFVTCTAIHLGWSDTRFTQQFFIHIKMIAATDSECTQEDTLIVILSTDFNLITP